MSGDVERLADGRWRLYYPHVDSSGIPDGIASAISNDGLGFAAEPGLRLGPLPGARFLSRPAIVRLADGRYRMYVSARPSSGRLPTGPFQIYSATSPDLLSWTLDAGVRQTGGSAPAALANPDGSIMLVFNAELRLGTGPPSYISTASAADGLSFSPKVPTNILPPPALDRPRRDRHRDTAGSGVSVRRKPHRAEAGHVRARHLQGRSVAARQRQTLVQRLRRAA